MKNYALATSWQVYFSNTFTPEQAAGFRQPYPAMLAGAPAIPIPGSDIDKTTADFDQLRPEGAGTLNDLALVTAVVDVDGEACTARMGIGVDWWFTLFLNGQPIYSTMESGNELGDISIFNHVVNLPLQSGQNDLTILAKRGSGTSWKFAAGILPDFLKEMTPRDFLRICNSNKKRIKCGPYFQAAADNRTKVAVLFEQPQLATLEWRVNRGEWQQMKEPPVAWEDPVSCFHQWLLPEMPAGTQLECRVASSNWDTRDLQMSPIISRLFPAGENTLFVTSDLQHMPQMCRDIIKGFQENCAANDAQAYCMLGDFSNLALDFKENYFDRILMPLSSGNPNGLWIPVRGNHEYRGPESGMWQDYAGDTFYDFRIGDTAFLVLDSGEDKGPTGGQHLYSMRQQPELLLAAQRQWLEKAISSPAFTTARQRVVICHATPFDQDADFGEFRVQYMSKFLDALLGDFFYGENPKIKLDLWLSGHTHHSCRFTPKDQQFAEFPDTLHHLTPREKGKYQFPVVVLDGPTCGGPCQVSGAFLRFTQQGIEVQCRQYTGEVIDHIFIRPDGQVDVLDSALSHQG